MKCLIGFTIFLFAGFSSLGQDTLTLVTKRGKREKKIALEQIVNILYYDQLVYGAAVTVSDSCLWLNPVTSEGRQDTLVKYDLRAIFGIGFTDADKADKVRSRIVRRVPERVGTISGALSSLLAIAGSQNNLEASQAVAFGYLVAVNVAGAFQPNFAFLHARWDLKRIRAMRESVVESP